jgi:hypothetical protein
MLTQGMSPALACIVTLHSVEDNSTLHMLSGVDLVRPLIIVVVLWFSIVLTASDGKLSEDLGDFGAKHNDVDDSKSGFTSMINGSQNREGYDPGYFFLYELGVYIQLEYGLAIYFSGLLYHCGTPSCTIDGSEPENDAVRITIILYPTLPILEGGQLLDFAAIPGSKMQTFRVPPEMSEAV